ncbi:hypothetical protein SAMN05216276_106716 [Streptosporangium subroseum]|uniref:Uncharacterized protein n=1 Tax=Streptosporangium subroseum TaxID=106412 RepID=A0A239NT06_9ACTN|nr:hypothetical protein SAMN05216276_106716 [Streptosporangium subroseum]
MAFARLSGDPGDRVRPFLPAFPGGSLSDGVVRLTPLTAADADDYHALQNLPDVVRYSVPQEGPSPARPRNSAARRACAGWPVSGSS